MLELRSAARLYILGLLALAVTGTFGALALSGRPDARMIGVAVVSLAALVVASRYPLHVGSGLKLSLDTAVILATALLIEPGMAMMVAGVGMLAGQGLRRDPLMQAIFNGSQAALQAGVVGGLLALGSWQAGSHAWDQPTALALVAGACLVMYLVNNLAVAIIGGLQTAQSIWAQAREALTLCMVEDVALYGIGLLAAAVVQSDQWLVLPLLCSAVMLGWLSLGRIYPAPARRLV